jgi:hypothetical protein
MLVGPISFVGRDRGVDRMPARLAKSLP